MSSSKPTRDVTINNLELGAILMQLLIFAPRMVPLAHIHTYANNTAAQGSANRGSFSTSSYVGPILWEISLVCRRQHIHTSVGRVPGEDNMMSYAASRLTGRHVQLTADVHDELETWRELVCSLFSRPTHLRKLQPFSPTWIGTTNASGSGMGGVCRYPEGQYFVWQYPL